MSYPTRYSRSPGNIAVLQDLLQLTLGLSLLAGCVGPGGADTASSEPNKQAIKLIVLDADGDDQRYALYRWRADGRPASPLAGGSHACRGRAYYKICYML